MEPRNPLFKKLSIDLNSVGPWSTLSVVRFYNPGMSLNLKSLSMVLEKAMAPHSSTLAWKIPWKEESGRLRSVGSLRVGYD